MKYPEATIPVTPDLSVMRTAHRLTAPCSLAKRLNIACSRPPHETMMFLPENNQEMVL
jgi:hypothetical protein